MFLCNVHPILKAPCQTCTNLLIRHDRNAFNIGDRVFFTKDKHMHGNLVSLQWSFKTALFMKSCCCKNWRLDIVWRVIICPNFHNVGQRQQNEVQSWWGEDGKWHKHQEAVEHVTLMWLWANHRTKLINQKCKVTFQVQFFFFSNSSTKEQYFFLIMREKGN